VSACKGNTTRKQEERKKEYYQRNKQRFSRRTLILVPKIFILCFLILNATPIEMSSVARDMKTPDVGFRIQLTDRWGSRKPSGIISDKGSKGSIRCRASEREILSVDLATDSPEFRRKIEKYAWDTREVEKISCEVIGGQIPLTFRK